MLLDHENCCARGKLVSGVGERRQRLLLSGEIRCNKSQMKPAGHGRRSSLYAPIRI